jgi:radical SAM enzyme (rSAM/lipoprotein system)
MPLEDFLSALDTVKQPSVGNVIVVLTGGEPLLRNDLEMCGREIRKREKRWGMVTNGQLYDRDKHIALLNAGMGALTISLDGNKTTHSWMRNSTTNFEKVDNAIALAASYSRLNFDVVTCVHQKNIDELPQIRDYLIQKKVKAWRLFTIIPIGRSTQHPELFLTDSQFVGLMDFIVHTRQNPEIDIMFSCEGYVGKYEAKVRDSYYFCRAGINIGSILIDGSISACPNIDRSFVQGNIYQDNLMEVWENKFHVFRNRKWTKTGKCAHCSDFKDCQGNGFHNWHGEKKHPLVCHKEKIS